MRTEIFSYYRQSGLSQRKLTWRQKNLFKRICHKIKRVDIGSEYWIELQYDLSRRSSSTFDCELRERFWKYSCKSCGSSLCVMPNTIMSYSKNISLGDRVYINSNSLLIAKAPIIIGNDVLIGPNTIINSGMHNYKDISKTIKQQGHKSAPIEIQDDVWVGANVIIMPGVTLGKGCVIGANSLINKSVEPYTVVAGSPAKVISHRGESD